MARTVIRTYSVQAALFEVEYGDDGTKEIVTHERLFDLRHALNAWAELPNPYYTDVVWPPETLIQGLERRIGYLVDAAYGELKRLERRAYLDGARDRQMIQDWDVRRGKDYWEGEVRDLRSLTWRMP